MFRYWLIALAGGLASILAFALAGLGLQGLLLFAYFAQLPLFLVGLGLGATAGAIAGAAATVTMVPIGGFDAAIGYAVLAAVPVIVLCRQALLSRQEPGGAVEWYPLGRLVMVLTGIAALTVALVSLYLALQPQDGEGSVQTELARALSHWMPEMPAGEQEEVLQRVMAALPGGIAASCMLMTTINGALGQGLLARFGRNFRPTGDFAAMAYPTAFPVVAAAVALAGFLPGALGHLGTNMLSVFVVAFFLLGLAVVHTFCRRTSAAPLLLIPFYVMMVLLPWLILAVAVLGVVEQLVQLRRRFA